MTLEELTLHFYEYFYEKKYNIKGLKLNQSDISKKHAATFVGLLKKKYNNSVGREFLYRYFIFQFSYWESANFTATNPYNKSINLTFIIGKKAFERFVNRDIEWDWKLENSRYVTQYKIVKSDLVHETDIKKKTVLCGTVDTEAAFKLAQYNKPQGLVNCIDFSTLFNPKSSICNGCNYQDSCRMILQQTYPVIYTGRGL